MKTKKKSQGEDERKGTATRKMKACRRNRERRQEAKEEAQEKADEVKKVKQNMKQMKK